VTRGKYKQSKNVMTSHCFAAGMLLLRRPKGHPIGQKTAAKVPDKES